MSSKAINGRRTLPAASDHELVVLARRGDELAISEIVRRYERPLRSYCAGLVGSDRAQDAVQQAFVQVVVALRAEGERDLLLRPWLYRIARNCSIDLLRKDIGDHDQLDHEFDGVPQPPAIAELREEIESLVTALRSLPEGQRRALTLREFEGRSYREIAGELGQTASSARQLIFRARSSLRGGVAALLPFAPLRAWLIGQAPASEVLVLAGASGARGTSLLDTAAAVAAATVALWGGGAAGGGHAAADPAGALATPPSSADGITWRSSTQQNADAAATLAFTMESRGAPSSSPGDETPAEVQAPVSALPVVIDEPASAPIPAVAGLPVEGPPAPPAAPSDIALDVAPVPGPAAGVAGLAPGGSAAKAVPAVTRPQVVGGGAAKAGDVVAPQRGGAVGVPTVRRQPAPVIPSRSPIPGKGAGAPVPGGTLPARTGGSTDTKKAVVQAPAGPQPARAPKRPALPTTPTRAKPARPALGTPTATASNPKAPTRR